MLPFRFRDVRGDLASPRDLSPHLQDDIAIVIVDVFLVPDRGPSVYFSDQSLEIHRHRVPTRVRVASPGRSLAGSSTVEKRVAGAEGGGSRARAASSSGYVSLRFVGVRKPIFRWFCRFLAGYHLPS